ncbi:MAG TPA: reverse transcriptase family protein [Candidatus Saccharimonadales bacterium]|nr:reverse transcriptase family protein [Candidatus Saccharimonadales bacterium]
MTSSDRITQLLDRYPSAGHAHRWCQPKEAGGVRPIATPNKELKLWLRAMNKELCRLFNAWPDFMHGGIKKRSYVTYARPHVGRSCVITIDIKRCFDSITQQEVADAMQQHLQLEPDICVRLAGVLCFKGKVAQGFPTSNYLCNLYLLQPLTDLYASLKTQGIAFGNYVDDLAASGTIVAPDAVVNEIALTLSRASLKMNKAKVLIMPSSKRQVVCGLIVNKHLSLTRQLKLKLFGDVARKRMSESSAEGWVANLKSVDPVFCQKFQAYAVKKGILK